MREQIIQLDTYDDYASARDRIDWAQAERVLLVWPESDGKPKILKRKLDLHLLQRHAERMGAEIAFITADPDVGDYAKELGVPIFDSVDDSHLFPWKPRRIKHIAPPPETEPPYDPEIDDPIIEWPDLSILRQPAMRWAFSTVIFVIAIGSIFTMLALTFPAATIAVYPRGQHITARVPVIADPTLSESDPEAGLIAADVRVVTVEGEITINTTGTVDEAVQRAGGIVTFTNQTTQPVRIPAGTAVRTSSDITPVRYVTQQDAELIGIIGSTANVPVLAVEPGPRSNIGAELVNQIEGPLSLSVAVINQSPMVGGDVVQAPAVTAEDREQAEFQLTDQLTRQGYAEMLATLTEHEFTSESSLRVVRVLDRAFSASIGEQANNLNLLMRIDVAITVVDENDSWPVGQAELERRVGDFLVLIPKSVHFERDPVTNADDSNRLLFEIVAQGAAGAVIDRQEVRQMARWMPVEQAEDLLYNTLPVSRPPQIALSPAWFPRLPWLDYQINVEIISEYNNAPPGS